MKTPREKQNAYVLELVIYLMIALLLTVCIREFAREQQAKSVNVEHIED